MLINDTNLTLCKATFADIAAATPLKDVERWDDGWGLDCKTDGPIEVEGMRFRASFSFEIEDKDDPDDAARLTEIHLSPVHTDDGFLEDLHDWKDDIFRKYDCILEDEDDNVPFYRVEIAYPDENEDRWRLTMYVNAGSYETEIGIEVECGGDAF